jgi:hypothetical protein
MMAPLISHLRYKIFNMKLYLILLSFLMFGFANTQVLPQGLIVNNNAYQTTIGANASINFYSPWFNLESGKYPAIISDYSFNFSNTTPYTIQFIFNKSYNWYSGRGFIGFTNASDGLSYSPESFMFYEFDGSIKYFIAYKYNAPDINYTSQYAFPTGRNFQITTTYDGTQWKHYLDGILKVTTTNNSTWNGNGKLMLGNIGAFTNISFDEVRFWDRALNQDEISYNFNKPLIGNENGLKLYYNFNNQGYPEENNTSIKYLQDQTINNNKGTFYNMPLLGVTNNFVGDKAQYTLASFDANNLDSYPGNGHGSDINNIKSASSWYDPSSSFKLSFYNSSNLIQPASPVLTADGGRSLLFNNIYGQTNILSGISSNGARTFEAWVKFNNLNNNSVVSIGNLANFDLFEMAVNNNKLILSIGTDLALTYNLKSVRTLFINTWYHIVITYSPILDPNLENYIIYINGAFDNSYVNQININSNSWLSNPGLNFNPPTNIVYTEMERPNTTNTNIFIGNMLRPFNGKLGVLKIYNRTLIADEVLSNYNNTKSRYGY